MVDASHFTSQRQRPEIILLDYVQTLVENGSDPKRDELQKSGRYRDWIKLKRFRRYLIDLLKDFRTNGGLVIILTARSKKYEVETMAQIREHGSGFWPDDAYFNPGELEPLRQNSGYSSARFSRSTVELPQPDILP